MNTWIEHLNHWGENFLSFAWPMLWQSTLLIVVVFALDYLLARRVRAAIRHALWMVMLVKLLLPPALALPTGATWWLWPAKPSLVPVIKTEAVTFDTTPLPDFVPSSIPMPVPPPPKLNAPGWTMLVSGAVSAGLLLSLLLNWLKVERKARRAAAGDFVEVMEEARQLARLSGPTRLRLVDDAISPAVYGLFRPVILLPRELAKKLSVRQLRAVLLHEAMHLRRGDVWVNCAQTLLQIAYWWHPLLWLANARIRQLREEAVDDAVMVALRGDADAYAPTLLEVAKFAFRRPLASLGLVGILESRSALRQRVERLVDFRPPRRAGVTFVSLFVIFLFGAVTLPMGQAPAAITESASTGGQVPPPSAPIFAPSSPSEIYIEGHFYRMPSRYLGLLTDGLAYDSGQRGEAPVWMAGAEKWDEIKHRIQTIGVQSFSSPRIQTDSGKEADMYSGNQTSWFDFDCTPVAGDEHIDLAFKIEIASVSAPGKTNLTEFHGHASMENQGSIILSAPNPDDTSSNLVLVISAKTIEPGAAPDIHSKLNRIHMAVSYQNATLGDVLSDLARRSRQFDPDEEGLEFVYSGSVPGRVEATERTAIHINLTLNDASLGQILDAVRLAADYPITYSVQEGAVVFAPRGAPSVTYEMRVFKVDPDKFPWYVRESLLSSSYTVPDPQTGGFSLVPPHANNLVKEFFQAQGVNLDPPKSIFFNNRLGILFVYATPQDLDTIERALSNMNVGTVKPFDKKKDADNLARAGQAAYEVHNMEDAIFDLTEALALDPDNQGAQYYLNLISQATTGSPSPQGSAHVSHAPFLLARPRPGYSAFADAVFAPLPSYQPVSAPANEADLKREYFNVGTAAFVAAVRKKTGESDAVLGFKELATKAGVDLSPPKALFLSEGKGMLWVYATEKDFDTIKDVLDGLHCPPQQIHIKARFIEVPTTFFDDVKNSIPSSATNGGVLTESQFKKFLHQLQSLEGTEELAEPEVTTLAGRQTQMRSTVAQRIVTNYLFESGSPNHPAASINAQMSEVEVGPILEVVPLTPPDGYTISLGTTASLIKFFGYADPNGLSPHFGTNYDGQKINLPISLPAFGVGEVTAQTALYDSQTLVLFPQPGFKFQGDVDEKSRARIVQHIQEAEQKDGEKTLVVLVTVTLIDQVGNRTHSDKQMSFAQNKVPPPWP